MAGIYSGSPFIIVATDSADSSRECFFEKEGDLKHVSDETAYDMADLKRGVFSSIRKPEERVMLVGVQP
jgi:hypothetical protein